MKNFSIKLTGTPLHPEYVIRYQSWFKSGYLWKSPITNVIHKISDINCASRFKTREGAMAVIEQFLNQK